MRCRWISLPLLAALGGCTTLDLYSDEGKRRLDQVSMRIDAFDIEVTSRGELVWRGVARVNRMQPAVYSFEAGEAAGPQCRPIGSALSSDYRMELRVHKYGGNAVDPDTYRFRATLERSELAPDCKSKITTHARAEKDAVRVRRGQRIELNGEGGLSVEIIRR